MTDDTEAFEARNREAIARMGETLELRRQSQQWINEAVRHEYTHHFTWLGLPIIQLPQDMIAMQEIIWRVRPRVIVETGVARGGSLVFYASLLELLGEEGFVVGVDIDVRAHNRARIESHPLSRRIKLIEGSSIDPIVVNKVGTLVADRRPVIVVLDSNHTHEHVLGELRAYAPLVPKGSYLIVFDTVIEDMPAGSYPDRPWDKGNNPKTAVHAFLQENARFEIDRDVQNKLQITVAPDGYLRCIKE
jgi:cephalosporin hydroxylase